jgi:hypothetical protein
VQMVGGGELRRGYIYAEKAFLQYNTGVVITTIF